MNEHVVLVNEQNQVLGTTPKKTVHTKNTPLHRAFSVFIFRNSDKMLLLQQRSLKKNTWPGVWSNSCCGHPSLNETNLNATKRRIKYELGLNLSLLEEVAPYRYTFIKDNIMENEICPILIGLTNDEPNINKKEVEAIKWIKWEDFYKDTKVNSDNWSPWCCEEATILSQTNTFNQIINHNKSV